MDKGGEWVIGCPVPLESQWRGLEKLVQMAIRAIRDCLERHPDVLLESIPLLLCVAERERPGRIYGLEDQLFHRIASQLGARFHRQSAVIPGGRVAVALALDRARHLIYDERMALCLIVGVDSMLVGRTLLTYERNDRLLTSGNSNGFIPGEAAAAVCVGPPTSSSQPDLRCVGIGVGRESATIDSGEPLRADGMVQAFRAAVAEAGLTLADTDYRITDLNCEQYGFKEAVLAWNRTLRARKETNDVWHPADCIGEVGAAIGPCVLGIALAAAAKGYAPGRRVLCHFAEDGGDRAAMVLEYGAG
jgi:3-oxoacyl-[acyl-carrier-protein] synthase I